MIKKISLGVFRRLDDRFLELSEADTSKMALALHNKRKNALQDVLKDEKVLKVSDWGDTNDNKPHEFVEIILGIVGKTVFDYALVPGLKYVGKKLAESAVDEAINESVKWVISKLRGKQESKEILNFQIKLPNGTTINVDPPDRDASITFYFNDGKFESIKYDSTEE